jgi:hypothetical protein
MDKILAVTNVVVGLLAFSLQVYYSIDLIDDYNISIELCLYYISDIGIGYL